MIKSNHIISIIIALLSCSLATMAQNQDKICGFTIVAPPGEFIKDPMLAIKEVNTNWVAIVPYGFHRKEDPNIRYNLDMQWWGEKKEGVLESIRLAHAQGFKVMLKPQIYVPGSWVGEVDFSNEKNWQIWEKNYEAFIKFYAQVAQEEAVELFCVGTEYKIAVQKRTGFWVKLIEEIRCDYDGVLSYSCNWDAYEKNPLWEYLDYIGISGYFPLSNTKTPSVKELKKAWEPIVRKLERFSKEKGKEIIFTEMGYLSVDHCADKTWELENQVYELALNEKAQSNAFAALFESFSDKNFWKGGFIWKWYPNKQGATNYFEKDYTPQGKTAEETIKQWHNKITSQ